MEKKFGIILISSILVSVLFGSLTGFMAGAYYNNPDFFNELLHGKIPENKQQIQEKKEIKETKIIKTTEESAVISVVDKVSPAVVSIIISKNLPIIERYYDDPFGSDFFGDLFGFNIGIPRYRQRGTEKKEIGGGSGFLVSSDGYVVTNKHVVYDPSAEYTVLMNDGKKYEAKVLARDPFTDLAILKIDGENFPYVDLGDSDNLKVGQTVVAIGNALGEFRNTVSTGVISGLARSISAGGSAMAPEELVGVIQTDASINPGNSGGPLLNLAGEVIGINTAMASGAENIGFALPINAVKDTIENVERNGKIVRPWIGIRYVLLNEKIAKENNLSVDYGALIVRGNRRGALAIVPESPAEKAGLAEGDIILEFDGQKIDEKHNLSKIIMRHSPGDKVKLKILREGEEKNLNLVLGEVPTE